MKSFLITGDRSGSGKTSITLALSALLSRDQSVQTFKVGMDYIDPSYLAGVTGRPCRNLDSFVLDPQRLATIYAHGCEGADIAIVEGVRGLFEGAEALSDRGTTADIAEFILVAEMNSKGNFGELGGHTEYSRDKHPEQGPRTTKVKSGGYTGNVSRTDGGSQCR